MIYTTDLKDNYATNFLYTKIPFMAYQYFMKLHLNSNKVTNLRFFLLMMSNEMLQYNESTKSKIQWAG